MILLFLAALGKTTEIVGIVLQRVKDAVLTVKMSKCIIEAAEAHYLGH